MIEKFCQSDERWGALKIIRNLTLASHGCVIVSLACLDSRTPDIILNLLKDGRAIDSLGRVIWEPAAVAINFIWEGVTTKPPKYPCIAMTNHYKKKGFPTHFVVWLGHDNLIIDPLTGSQLENPYHIVSYRLFYRGENG